VNIRVLLNKKFIGVVFALILHQAISAQVIFFEDFTTIASTSLWTMNVASGFQGTFANKFLINDFEGGGIIPNLGAPGSCSQFSNSNSTLFVGEGWGGSFYNKGYGLCFAGLCVSQTDKRCESPVINCTGMSNVVIKFNYIENGSGSVDNATLLYYDGVTWNTIDDMPKSTIGCTVMPLVSHGALWNSRSVNLPSSADNNPNIKIGFRWVNNDDGVGADPAFAVDSIIVQGVPIANTCDTSKWVGSYATIGAVGSQLDASAFIDSSNSHMYLSPVNSPWGYFWTQYKFKDTMCVSSDFTIEYKIKNPIGSGISAYDCSLGFETSSGPCWATLMGEAWAQSFTSVGVNGSVVLSNQPYLVFPNLLNWSTVKMEFAGGMLNFYMNGTLFTSVAYPGNICSINGLYMSFKGAGYVDFVKITNSQNDTLYFEDFNNCSTISSFDNYCNPPQFTVSKLNPNCSNDTLKLFATPTATQGLNYLYAWTGPNGFTSTQQNPTIASATPAANGVYSCKVSINTCISDSTKSITVSGIGSSGLQTTTVNQSICQGTSYLGYSTAGTYVDSFISTFGCDSIRTLNLIVNPLPSITSATSPNDTICANSAITLAGSGASTYTWTGSVANNAAFTPTASGTYTLTGTDVNGCTNTTTTSIVVLPLPIISIASTTNPATICNGDSIKLTATGASTYAWTNGVTNNTYFKPAANNIYTVTGTNASGCSNTNTISITVNQLPVVSITANPNTALCAGANVTLTGNGASTYALSNSVINAVAFTPTATNTYTITGTDASGCTSTATKIVTVNALPIVGVTSTPANATVCAGKPLTLAGTGASTYAWSGGVANNTAFIPTTSGTYTVTGTDANGCTNTTTTSIVVLPLPVISIASAPNPATICKGDSISLTANGASSYAWSGGINNSVNFAPLFSNTYTVTATATNGCTNTATKYVLVHPLPAIGINANPSASICAGKNVTLTASGGSTYSWTNSITNGIAFTPINTNTYTVTVTTVNGCVSTSTQAITVNALPTVTSSAYPNPPVVCAGQSIKLIGAGASTYTWTGGIINNTLFALNNSGTYTVTGTDANGCTGTSLISATANPLPIININATPGNGTMCQYDSVYLIASGAPTLVWDNGMNNGAYVYPNTNTTYTVTGTNGFACTASKTITVNVLPVVVTLDTVHMCDGVITFFEQVLIPSAGNYTITLPSTYACDSIIHLTAIYHPQPIGKINGVMDMCVGDTITLQASIFDAGTVYNWNVDEGLLLANTDNKMNYTYDKPGMYEVQLLITPPAPCVPREAYDTINVHDVTAQIVSSAKDATLCAGEQITLASYYYKQLQFKWMLDGAIIDTNRATFIKPTNNATVILQVQDEWNCTDEDTIRYTAQTCCTMFMPSAFSPNDDGLNDKIKPVLDYNTSLVNYSVFNQWGEKIFTTTQKDISWDGYYQGVACDGDTYYYLVQYTCNGVTKTESGAVQLIK
jgi:gliding motility-associated-like protein